MFDPQNTSGQELVFKFAKGDGFPQIHARFGIVVLSTVPHATASKVFDDAISPTLVEFAIQSDG